MFSESEPAKDPYPKLTSTAISKMITDNYYLTTITIAISTVVRSVNEGLHEEFDYSLDV